jgi:hypothetical protein
MGKIDQATDLVRRCLYCYECAFMETFKPYNGHCRLNPALEANRSFFTALYRYMFICSRQHHISLACNLAIIILSLNPLDESCLILLHLDYLLLSAGRYAALLTLCGDPWEDGDEAENENAVHWQRCYVIDACDTTVDSIGLRITVEYLPNWWYSLALAKYLQTGPGSQGRKHASQLLQAAIKRWPYILLKLFEQVLPSSPILSSLHGHTFFNTAKKRYDAFLSVSIH